VVVVILAVVGGAPAGTAAAQTHEFSGIVTVRTLPGWELIESQDDEDLQAILLEKGTSLFAVYALAGYAGSPEQLADEYLEALRDPFDEVTLGSSEPVTLAGGVPGVRFGYVGETPQGVTVEGIVTAAVGPGGGAVFDGAAPSGDLAAVIEDLKTMIETAEFA
jgi:hypothetical protein